MIKLVVKLCLVLNPYVCLSPIEVVPVDKSEITSITSCLMGGVIYSVRIGGADYSAKIFCSQAGQENLSSYLREKAK